MLVDFPVLNQQFLKQPGEPYGSDHACLSVELPWINRREFTIIPNKKCRTAFLKFIEQGKSIHEAIVNSRSQFEPTALISGERRTVTDL